MCMAKKYKDPIENIVNHLQLSNSTTIVKNTIFFIEERYNEGEINTK